MAWEAGVPLPSGGGERYTLIAYSLGAMMKGYLCPVNRPR